MILFLNLFTQKYLKAKDILLCSEKTGFNKIDLSQRFVFWNTSDSKSLGIQSTYAFTYLEGYKLQQFRTFVNASCFGIFRILKVWIFNPYTRLHIQKGTNYNSSEHLCY